MSEQLLPPLRPSTLDHSRNKVASLPSAMPGMSGSCDPRFPEQPRQLVLERVDSSSAKTCRAIHQLWNQDVLEFTRRVIRLEAELRLERQNVASLEDRVNDLEGKVQLFQEEIQALRNEAHEERENMHQILAKIQFPCEEQVRHSPHCSLYPLTFRLHWPGSGLE